MGENMKLNIKNKMLVLIVSTFALCVFAFALQLTISSNILLASYNEWHYVTICAKLNTVGDISFFYDLDIFTEDMNEARFGDKWFVIEKDEEGQVVYAKKYVQVGGKYGRLPSAIEGYDGVNWQILDTDSIISANSEFYSASDQTIVLNVDYHRYQIVYQNCENANNTNPTYHTIQSNVQVGSVSKTGYTFLGWTTTYEPSPTKTYNVSADEKSDITLVANWRVNTYQVKFNANGATGSIANQTFEYDKTYSLDSVLGRMSYGTKNFVGWATYQNGHAVFCDKSKVCNLTSTDSAVFNLYAIWSDQNVYQLRYNSNGGTGFMSDQPFIYEEPQNLISNLFSKRGFHFVGWNDKSDGTGTQYPDEQEVKNLTATNNQVVDLYAIWQENSYVINFNANGGEGEMNSQMLNYTEIKKLSKNTFTNQNLEFACWNTQSDGKGDAYTNEQLVSRLAESGEITLFAVWQPKTHDGLSTTAIVIVVFAVVVVAGVVVTTILVKKKMN